MHSGNGAQISHSEPVTARIIRAAALAQCCIDQQETPQARAFAEASLTLMLDDPSPKVRIAIADVLSTSAYSPLHIVTALAADQPEVAGYIVARSPLLGEADLIDRVSFGAPLIQLLVAARPHVSMPLAAAIAEVGTFEAIAELLRNRCARIAALTFRRIAERCGHDAQVREALLVHAHLPADCRHLLVVKVGDTLRQMPLVHRLLGERRAEKLVGDAAMRASIDIAEACSQHELPALVEHLRLRGEVTTAFIIRVVAGGRIDLFAALMASLSDLDEDRICSIISRGRPAALAALLRSAGLGDATHPALIAAVEAWRAVASGRSKAGPVEISALMRHVTGKGRHLAANDDLSALLSTIHQEFMRQTARERLNRISVA